MNEVHVTTAKVVLISLVSGAMVALLVKLLFKVSGQYKYIVQSRDALAVMMKTLWVSLIVKRDYFS